MEADELLQKYEERVERMYIALLNKILSVKASLDDKLTQVDDFVSIISTQNVKALEKVADELRLYTDTHIDEFLRQEQLHEDKLYTIYDIIRAKEDEIGKELTKIKSTLTMLKSEIENIHAHGCGSDPISGRCKDSEGCLFLEEAEKD